MWDREIAEPIREMFNSFRLPPVEATRLTSVVKTASANGLYLHLCCPKTASPPGARGLKRARLVEQMEAQGYNTSALYWTPQP